MKNKIILSLFILGHMHAPTELPGSPASDSDAGHVPSCNSHRSESIPDILSITAGATLRVLMEKDKMGNLNKLFQWREASPKFYPIEAGEPVLMYRFIMAAEPLMHGFKIATKHLYYALDMAAEIAFAEEAHRVDLSKYLKPNSHLSDAIAAARFIFGDRSAEELPSLNRHARPIVSKFMELASPLSSEKIEEHFCKRAWDLATASHTVTILQLFFDTQIPPSELTFLVLATFAHTGGIGLWNFQFPPDVPLYNRYNDPQNRVGLPEKAIAEIHAKEYQNVVCFLAQLSYLRREWEGNRPGIRDFMLRDFGQLISAMQGVMRINCFTEDRELALQRYLPSIEEYLRPQMEILADILRQTVTGTLDQTHSSLEISQNYEAGNSLHSSFEKGNQADHSELSARRPGCEKNEE